MKPDLDQKTNIPLIKSFGCAVSGIVGAYLRERNFRIHLGVAIIACALGVAFPLARAEWGILLLTIGLVLSCELFNSALEHLADFTCDEQPHPLVGMAKDIAAGAVLVSALVAVGVGVFLFGNPARLVELLWEMLEAPLFPAVVLVVTLLMIRLPDQIRKTKQEEEDRKRSIPPGY